MRKVLSMILLFVILISTCLTEGQTLHVYAANDSGTYANIGNGFIVEYDFGKTNGVRDYGFIFVPDVEGELPGMVLMHGGTGTDEPADKVSNGKLGQNWMNTLIKKGNLQPRIVIMPMVPNTSTTDKNHQNYDYPVFLNKLFPIVLDRMEDGTFNELIEAKAKSLNVTKKTYIDTTIKKHVVTGYSMGGGASLYVGAKYKDRCPYIGALSPAERFCMWRTDTNPNLWMGWAFENGLVQKDSDFNLNKPEPKFYIEYSSEPDRFLFMAQSNGEASYFSKKTIANGGYIPAERFYERFAQKSGFEFCRFLAGGHDKNTDLRELFCFLYQLETGKAPNKNMLVHVCGVPSDDNMVERVYYPNDVPIDDTFGDPTEKITGTLVKTGVDGNPKVGDRLGVQVNNSNCNEFNYSWFIKDDKTEYLKCTNPRCDVNKNWVGCSVICRVTDASGKYGDNLMIDFGVVEDGSATPKPSATPTPKPTATPTPKPTATPTPKPSVSPSPSATPTPAKLSGTVEFVGNFKYGETVTVSVKGGNADSYVYLWQRGIHLTGNRTNTFTCSKEDIGQQIKCIVRDSNDINGTKRGQLVSLAYKVQKADGPAEPSGIKAVATSKYGATDGQIIGVSTAMEYSSVEDFSKDVVACNEKSITGLKAGTYYIRLKETETTKAGKTAKVTIQEGPKPTAKPTVTPTPKPTATPAAKPTATPSPVIVMRASKNASYTGEIAQVFKDVDAAKWYCDAVKFVYGNGIMKGTSSDTFTPDMKLTRGQFITVLYNMSGRPTATGNNPFEDVKEEAYYYDPVRWAYANEITAGTSATMYSPDKEITREETVTMLYKYIGLCGFDTSYEEDALLKYMDHMNVQSWATDAMKWASTNQVINGKTAGESVILDPAGLTSRAECAQIIANLFK